MTKTVVILFLSAASMAQTILVGPRDSEAYSFAESQADGSSTFAERKLFKALVQAAQLANQAGPQTVIVKVAAGAYTGKANMGIWMVPQLTNPEAKLHILGGYDDQYKQRNPFTNLVNLVTSEGRNGAFLQFAKKSEIGELVISGLVFDAAPSNKYDDKTNSILKGTSRTYNMISFSQLKTQHLVVDSNVFINGSHGAFDPFIMPADANATIDITNNFFINNIKTLKTEASSNRGAVVKTMRFANNSFILNWPYNPDPTSGEVSCINLYHKGGAAAVVFDHNLFAFNPGGAMQHDWPEDRMPALTLKQNLFFMNAGLFGDGKPDAGVFAGKFSTNPKYLLCDLITIEDDFSYTCSGNQAFEPKIPITLSDLQGADSTQVQRKDTVLNDIRRLFGLNQDGGTVAIANYAPSMTFNPQQIPLPTEAKAKPYGVQIDQHFQ